MLSRDTQFYLESKIFPSYFGQLEACNTSFGVTALHLRSLLLLQSYGCNMNFTHLFFCEMFDSVTSACLTVFMYCEVYCEAVAAS